MLGLEVDGGEEEEVDWRENARDRDVDVEGPAPGCGGHREGTADDRAENTAYSPHEADAGNVGTAFMGRGLVCEIVECAEVDPSSSHTGKNAANDQGGHGWGRTAESGADFEKKDATYVDPFLVEFGVERADEENDSDGAERETRTQPG